MKRTTTLLCTAFFMLCNTLSADIIETNHIGDIRNYIKPNSLVIFDIDNTIMETAQELGSDQWFYHRLQQNQAAGMEFEEALDETLAEWYAVQSVSKVKLVEPCAADVIRGIQNDGYTVMGLTTRGLGLCRTTIHQLKSLKVNLDTTAPTHEEIHFMNKEGVLFRKGILFTAGSHKGIALAKFLHLINQKPDNIVFINDKATHLRPIEEICEKYGVPFIGLRYGFLDEKVANFRSDIADIQYEAFGHIISDEAAEFILRSREIELMQKKN